MARYRDIAADLGRNTCKASAPSCCATKPVPRPVDVLAELRSARSAINRAIAALEKAESQVTRPDHPA